MNARIGTSIANDGRNEIRVNNSAGRCLLENWVEERANYGRDPPLDREYNMAERSGFLRSGHPGLLTIDDKAKAEDRTTVRLTYTVPDVDKTRRVGLRAELMEKAFAAGVMAEMQQKQQKVEDDFKAEPLCSTFMQDYTKDFPKNQPAPTKDHDLVKEQPVTFWSEHKDKIHGCTQTKTRDTAFRKNDAFSKPIGEYWDESKPYEFDQYPMM
ncbi:sperm-associated antigen 8-like [Elysia marginata]|uniref:Sperm-associated antigen 8-like n=1 Tax=Elysia marginata TaxID=1093978 RepID=A0AAV4JZ71_9GAST|nr:sperm-associated antigen 8-like [Elysia marginata]